MRTLFGALSVPPHTSIRCFQRSTFLALASERAANGWLRLPGGSQVLLRYVMSSPATPAEEDSMHAENATHRDIIALPVPNRESACAEKIFVWLGLASSWIDADFYGILDDDTFVHLERVAADLRAHAGSSRLFYGQFSWADAWDARKARHHGYNNQQNQVLASAARHLRRQRDRSEAALAEAEGAPAARNGPFPLPLGFLMILGASLARAVGGSAGATALGAYLRRADAEGRRQHAPPCGAQ
jgi:hypothetical protein